MISSNLSVIILTHDRPDLVLKSLSSICRNLKAFDFNIFVSDNSPNDFSKNLILRYIKKTKIKIDYQENKDCHSSRSHFKKVINNCTTKYCMLFHDDDVLMPNAFDELQEYFNKLEKLSAIGFNGYLLKGKIYSNHLYCRNITGNEYYTDNKLNEFIESYLGYLPRNVPFPSFIYRTDFLKKSFNKILEFNETKHADLQLLVFLLKYGPILVVNKPLMYYRIHAGSDSHSENMADRKALISNLIDAKQLHEGSILKDIYLAKSSINFHYSIFKNQSSYINFTKLLFICLFNAKFLVIYFGKKLQSKINV